MRAGSGACRRNTECATRTSVRISLKPARRCRRTGVVAQEVQRTKLAMRDEADTSRAVIAPVAHPGDDAEIGGDRLDLPFQHARTTSAGSFWRSPSRSGSMAPLRPEAGDQPRALARATPVLQHALRLAGSWPAPAPARQPSRPTSRHRRTRPRNGRRRSAPPRPRPARAGYCPPRCRQAPRRTAPADRRSLTIPCRKAPPLSLFSATRQPRRRLGMFKPRLTLRR